MNTTSFQKENGESAAIFEVTDDSGFLALVVPATYRTFVASDWTFDQIMLHFRQQMESRSLLFWGTGLEGCWKVRVNLQRTNLTGFREITGSLRVDGGSILVTNYESLTMAAQFEDVTLPEKHQQDLLLAIPDGDYLCRIIRMFDPEDGSGASNGQPDFVVEIYQTHEMILSWRSIPWCESYV